VVGHEREQGQRECRPEQRQSQLPPALGVAGGVPAVRGGLFGRLAVAVPNRRVAGVLDGVVERRQRRRRRYIGDLCLVGGVVHLRGDDARDALQRVGVRLGAVRTRKVRDKDGHGLRVDAVAGIFDGRDDIAQRDGVGVVAHRPLVGGVVRVHGVDPIESTDALLDGPRAVRTTHPRQFEAECSVAHLGY